MILEFIGAAHEVTGSCHYLEVSGSHILVDCGMEQGADTYENADLPVSAAQIDYVFVTHAHIDHTGLLPLLYARGFRGQVYATKATVELCDIMLRDSAHIQMMEAEWKNRKAKRSGGAEMQPLYTVEDVYGLMKRFVPCEYGTVIAVNDSVKIRFTDVGHLLGSASIEVWAAETEKDGGKRKEVKLVFSGDIGNTNQPILKDPVCAPEADYVIMESTYGDRQHAEQTDYVAELADIIRKTLTGGGNVVIPSFAVGRTQELLYFIRKIKLEHMIPECEDFPVYVDSPLAIEATTIFNRNIHGYFDKEAMELVKKGINPISFPGLKTAITSDESKLINFDTQPKVIISASGMCEAGRIRHHLKHNLWRPESTIVFVGYQANGTLGRALLEGAKEVKLFGETVEVRAEIRKLAGVSGHADKNGLLSWITGIPKKPVRTFVVHGDDGVCDTFAECLNKEYGIPASAPYSGYRYDLLQAAWLEQHKPALAEKRKEKKRGNSVFERLLAAGERLLAIIRKNEGMANKDMAKFTDQINALCDKYE